MDTLTHIALGAVIGEGVAGKKLGKRAMLYGALLQSLPDIDFVAAFWSTPVDNALAHRGFTHSILFGIISTMAFAWLASHIHRPFNISLKRWTFFFGLEVFTHLFIDAFNAYGVGWFEPFHHARFSFHTLFVADPLFSIPVGVVFVVLLIAKPYTDRRRKWALASLVITVVYLLYALSNKQNIETDVKASLAENGISSSRHFTTPTPFNNWLWYVVIEEDSGYHVSHHSVFDDEPLQLTYFKKDVSLLKPFTDQETVKKLVRFSQGYYTVEQWNDTLVFNDLRFGQIVGWHDPKERFVFHYYLSYPDENTLVLQRGRFAKWDRETLRSLFRRMRGLDVDDNAER